MTGPLAEINGATVINTSLSVEVGFLIVNFFSNFLPTAIWQNFQQ